MLCTCAVGFCHIRAQYCSIYLIWLTWWIFPLVFRRSGLFTSGFSKFWRPLDETGYSLRKAEVNKQQSPWTRASEPGKHLRNVYSSYHVQSRFFSKTFSNWPLLYFPFYLIVCLHILFAFNGLGLTVNYNSFGHYL